MAHVRTDGRRADGADGRFDRAQGVRPEVERGVGEEASRSVCTSTICLKIASERKASDLHLKVGSHPVLRINGELVPLVENKRLMQEDTIAMAFSIMSNRQKQKFKDNLEIDIAYSVPGLGRFRCNVFQQRGTVGLVLRVIPVKILTVRELGLPIVLEKICNEQRGLILCTGTTGSGKSTSLAAMIDYINSQRTRAHHHHRGPHRVPAPGQEVHREPARGGGGHALLRRRPALAPCARTPT